MILGKDIHPQKNIYYLGAIVIEILKSINNEEGDFFFIYQQVNRKENISVSLFVLTLDWLFILGLVENKKGLIKKCF
jgi:hypothetical protein